VVPDVGHERIGHEQIVADRARIAAVLGKREAQRVATGSRMEDEKHPFASGTITLVLAHDALVAWVPGILRGTFDPRRDGQLIQRKARVVRYLDEIVHAIKAECRSDVTRRKRRTVHRHAVIGPDAVAGPSPPRSTNSQCPRAAAYRLV